MNAPQLTATQQHVLERIALGVPQELIARELGHSSQSIRRIAQNVREALGALSTPHAILLACRAGLLDGKAQRHGDHAGFIAHERRGETPCDDCWVGEREYRSERHAARKRVPAVAS